MLIGVGARAAPEGHEGGLKGREGPRGTRAPEGHEGCEDSGGRGMPTLINARALVHAGLLVTAALDQAPGSFQRASGEPGRKALRARP